MANKRLPANRRLKVKAVDLLECTKSNSILIFLTAKHVLCGNAIASVGSELMNGGRIAWTMNSTVSPLVSSFPARFNRRKGRANSVAFNSAYKIVDAFAVSV